MTETAKRAVSYKQGYREGIAATQSALCKGIEEMLTDDTEVIISDGEVFVPISALRNIISKLEVK